MICKVYPVRMNTQIKNKFNNSSVQSFKTKYLLNNVYRIIKVNFTVNILTLFDNLVLSPAPWNLHDTTIPMSAGLLQREVVCIIVRGWLVVGSIKIHGTNIYQIVDL